MRDYHRLSVAEALTFAKAPVACDYLPSCFEEEFNFNGYHVEDNTLTYRDLSKVDLLEYVFDSDEVAVATLYYYKGSPFMLYEKYGDRNGDELTILDAEAYKSYATFLYQLTLESKGKNAETLNEKILGFPYGKQNQYLAISNGYEGYAAHILNPRWQLGFGCMFDDHHALYEGQPVKFIGFASDRNDYSDERHKVKIKLADGQESIVDGWDIAFVFKGQMLGSTINDEKPAQEPLKDRFGDIIDMMDDTVYIFCDGACRGNPGPGGLGVYLRQKQIEQLIYAGSSQATNNQMEMSAALWALEYAMKLGTVAAKVVLHTDSKYVVDGITSWLPNWKKKNWKTASGDPVKNLELWKALDRANSLMKVEWKWVKGHAGHAGNELADQLANQGVDECLKSKKEYIDPVCQTINLAKAA